MMKYITGSRSYSKGFSLVEMLFVVAVIGLLMGISLPSIYWVYKEGKSVKSSNNLRQLALANLSYVADNDGEFAPAQDRTNRMRWHGSRDSLRDSFDPTDGYLAPYLGKDGKVKICPLVDSYVSGSSSWEDGTGGYGYNATYVGGRPGNPYEGNDMMRIPYPSKTVMFTTTGFSKAEGVQEYPYSEPYQWIDRRGRLRGSLQPSVHFRANGKALVAWCDGRVSREAPNEATGPNYYGASNVEDFIGWFGPEDNNGYWNPEYQDLQ